MTEQLQLLCTKAAKLIQTFPKKTKIRVVSHYDADGITSAAIICKALYRQGYNFHVTLMRNPFTKGMQRIKEEENELIIFSDMGSAQIEIIETLGPPAIIIDHHQYLAKETREDIIQINANQCGIDGNYETCGATLSYSFALALNPENKDLIVYALAGAVGDKQHIGGIKGYNKTLLENALKKGFIKEKIGVKLTGENISEALFYSIDPYYKHLSGKKEEIQKILTKLNINPSMQPENIEEKQKIQLQSYLIFNLIKTGVQKNILDTVVRKRYISDILGCELEQYADLLDACGKGNHRGLALSVILGDKDALTQASQVQQKYRNKILDALISLEKEGIHELQAMRYFHSDESSLGGVICGIAVNYLTDEQKPLFSIARKKDEIHVSCRGNQELVKKGLDLGGGLKIVTKDIGGHGGGHKIAAGATIDGGKEEIFLKKIDETLNKQIKR